MDGLPLTFGNLVTIAGAFLAVILGVLKIAHLVREQERQTLGAIEAMRAESGLARAKLYDRLEQMRQEISVTYVRQDVHAETQARLLHALEEYSRILSAKVADAPPPPAAPRVRHRQRRQRDA